MQFELRTDDDDRTPGVVDPLPQEVLPETALLSPEHVAQGFQGLLVCPENGPSPLSVIEEGIHGLLEHPLLVPDDDLGSVQFQEPLETIVPIDHPSIEIVQIGGRKSPAVEGNQGPKIRRDHRNHLQNHPLRFVPRFQEGFDDLESLCQPFFLRLRGRLLHLQPELLGEVLHIGILEQFPDRIRSLGHRKPIAIFFPCLPVPFLGKGLPLLQGRLFPVDHQVGLEIEDPFQFSQRHIEKDPDLAGDAPEKPDMGHRGREADMPHPLPPHLRLDDLDPALLADDAAVFHPLVLAAVTFIILGGAEDLGAEETVFLGFKGPVVDGLRFFHFSMGPGFDLLRRGDRNPDGVKTDRILHLFIE